MLARGTAAEDWVVPAPYIYLYRDECDFPG